MKRSVRVLLVEDFAPDAELIVLALEESGLTVTHLRVETESALRQALFEEQWDIVLSDYSLPRYSGLKALAEVRAQKPDLPVILISGAIGEETAVEAMKLGAADYLMKGKLGGLGATLERHIAEAAARVERRHAAEALLARDRRRSRELLKLAEVSLAIGAAQSIEALIKVGTDSAAEIIETHQAVASITRGTNWSQAVKAIFLSPKYESSRDNVNLATDSGMYRLVCRENKPLRFTQAEAEAHPAWKGFGREVAHLPMRGWLAAPLIGRDARNIGLIQLSDKIDGSDFTPDDEAVLVQIAQILSVAIENVRLFEETKRAYEESKRTNKMKDEFLATLSHELRTPLNAILGNAELLEFDEPGSKDFNESLETIKRNARAQNELINELLDVSRIITGKLTLEIAPVDLAPLARAAVSSMRFAAEAKSISLNLAIESDVGPLLGDGNRLQQVLWNLLSNSIKFTPRGGRVDIALKHSRTKIQVDVTDTGEGIEQAFLPYVFERFRQEDSSSTRNFGGLGLGLAIVRHIVELHGGTVHVESEGKGKGTTFRICLPPLAVRDELIDASLSSEAQETGSTRERFAAIDLSGLLVLVCDDQKDSREMVSKVLGRAKAAAELAGSAEEAFALAESGRFDAFVFDLGMPEEDGVSLIRRVRALGGKPAATPAIALTAYVRGEDQALTQDAGFQLHLAKPVLPSVLLSGVAKLCKRI